MTKLSRKQIDPENFGHYVNNLWSVFTLLNSKEDIRLLFKDLFTHTEYKMFAKRLEIAYRLQSGERYEDIQNDLNVTAPTITRINNVLNEKGDGLRKACGVLQRLEEKRLKGEKQKIAYLSNPALAKLKRKTLGGALLKAGFKALDSGITQKLAERSVKKELPM